MHCRKCPTNLCHVTLKTVCRLEKLTVDKKYNIISLICCKITKEKMMRFWCHWLLANMPFTEEYKIIIKCPTNLCHVTLKTVYRLEKLTVDKNNTIIFP